MSKIGFIDEKQWPVNIHNKSSDWLQKYILKTLPPLYEQSIRI